MVEKKAVGSLALLKAVTAILSVVYSVIQVHYFGTSEDIEIYFASTALITIMFSLSQSGVISEIFLPTYLSLKEEKGVEMARKVFSLVINRISIAIGLISLLAVFIAPFLIELIVPGFTEEAKQKVVLMFRVTSFLLFFQVLSSFFNTILNAENIYGRTELIGIARVVLNLIILLLLYRSIGVWSLVVSLICGHLLAFGSYIFLLRKKQFRFYQILHLPEFDHLSFFTSVYSSFFYVGSTQIYSIVLNSSISLLPQGYFAVFNYVSTLYTKTRSVFTQPLTTVFFTSFSKGLAEKSNKLVNLIRDYINLTFLVISVVLLLVASFGDILLHVLWGSDKFSKDLTYLAAQILVFNYIALLVTSIGNIYRKIAISLQQANIAYLGWAVAQLITALCVYLILKYFKEDGLVYIFLINVTLLNSVSWLLVANFKKEYAISFDGWGIIKLALLFLFTLPIGWKLNALISGIEWIQGDRIFLMFFVSIASLLLLITYTILGYVFKVKEVISLLSVLFFYSKKLFLNK